MAASRDRTKTFQEPSNTGMLSLNVLRSMRTPREKLCGHNGDTKLAVWAEGFAETARIELTESIAIGRGERIL